MSTDGLVGRPMGVTLTLLNQFKLSPRGRKLLDQTDWPCVAMEFPEKTRRRTDRRSVRPLFHPLLIGD